jgi:hypothetical protein
VKLESFDAATKPKIIKEVKALVPNLTLIEVRGCLLVSYHILSPFAGEEVRRVSAEGAQGEHVEGGRGEAQGDIHRPRRRGCSGIIDHDVSWSLSFLPVSYSVLLQPPPHHLTCTGQGSCVFARPRYMRGDNTEPESETVVRCPRLPSTTPRARKRPSPPRDTGIRSGSRPFSADTKSPPSQSRRKRPARTRP